MSQLVTGEAVALDIRTAGLPSRMLAASVDGVIQVVLFFLLMLLVGAFGSSGSPAVVAALVIGTIVVAGLVYPVLFETLMRGRTPGKAAMGLRVVRDDAGPISFRQAFVRGLIGLFVERPGITFFSAAVITSLLNEQGKRLGDLLAGTVVIQERVVGGAPDPVQMPPPLAGWAQALDLSRLPDDLALAARSFLGRSSRMTEAARADLGARLAAAVSQVVTPPPPPGTPGWAYLSAVLAERRARTEARLSPAYGVPPVSYGAPAPSYASAPAPLGGPAPSAGASAAGAVAPSAPPPAEPERTAQDASPPGPFAPPS
ncbi:MAG: RDD family protein [Mycobacteriales bacterium]